MLKTFIPAAILGALLIAPVAYAGDDGAGRPGDDATSQTQAAKAAGTDGKVLICSDDDGDEDCEWVRIGSSDDKSKGRGRGSDDDGSDDEWED